MRGRRLQDRLVRLPPQTREDNIAAAGVRRQTLGIAWHGHFYVATDAGLAW